MERPLTGAQWIAIAAIGLPALAIVLWRLRAAERDVSPRSPQRHLTAGSSRREGLDLSRSRS